jgi:hypothetical protein
VAELKRGRGRKRDAAAVTVLYLDDASTPMLVAATAILIGVPVPKIAAYLRDTVPAWRWRGSR